MKSLAGILMLLALFGCQISKGTLSDSSSISSEDIPLKELASARGIYIGTAVTPGPLFNNPEVAYSNILVREFNIIVAENDMKFENLEPSSNNFNFSTADKIVNLAIANGMKIRGHVLVWHQQSGWASSVNNPEALSNILSNHIFTVMRLFSNKVQYWDVVNEAIDDNLNNSATTFYPNLRKSFWWTNLGSNYIEYAFQLARAADPTAKLFYNDYSIEAYNNKAYYTFLLVSNLKAKGLIDGIGLQMHIDTNFNPYSNGFANNLKRFSDLGLEIHITEMDVRIPVPSSYENYTAQAKTYKDVLTVALANTNVKAIIFWGFTDKYSWVPQFFTGYGNALLFDKNYNKKKAYDAVWEVLK